MVKRRLPALVVALLTWAACLSSGCEVEFIADEARTSLASFLTGVAATAVDETIGP